MVTEGVFALLLVVSFAAVALPLVVRDTSICNETPYGIQRAFIYCYMDYLVRLPSYMGEYGQRHQVLTKKKMLVALNDQCTKAYPAGLACFTDSIKGCNASFQEHLNRLGATGAGFVCQPGGAGLEPALSYLLNSISDENLRFYMTAPCQMRHRSCYEAFGTDSHRQKLPLDALVSVIQSGVESFVLCTAEDYEAAKATCPYWREDLLMRVISIMSHPFLGLRLPFTQQDLVDMFQI